MLGAFLAILVPSLIPIEGKGATAIPVPAASYAASAASTGPDGDVARAPDGLFYVTGTVNGVAVRFLVDTGASATVLTREDALRAGVLPQMVEFRNVADTANGIARVTWVKLGELEVAGLHVRGMPAAVTSGDLKVSLLGQDWLSSLDSVTIAGDRMLLRY